MRFTALTLGDFMSYGEQHLDLDCLDYAVLSGRNGSGKSSVALAIAWALFGTARVKGDADSVIRDDQKSCSVVLEFQSEGALWRIERAKSRGKSAKVRLYSRPDADADWSPYGDHLNATAQSRIEELVGMTEDAFYSLTLIDGASGVRFIKADSAQRRDILLSLLPEMGVWGRYEDRAREMLADARSEVEREQTRLASDEERIAETTSAASEAREGLEALDPDRLPGTLADVERDIKALEKKIDDASKGPREALDKAEAAHKARKGELRGDVREATHALETIEGKCRSLRGAIKDLDDARDALAATEGDAARSEDRLASAEMRLGSLAATEGQIEALKATVRTENEASAVARARAQADDKSLVGLRAMQAEHSAQCPTCQTHLDDDSLTALIVRIEATREDALARALAHSKAAEDAAAQGRAAEKALDEAAAEVEALSRAVDLARARIERARADVARYEARVNAAHEATGYASIEAAEESAKSAGAVLRDAQDAYDAYCDKAEADLDRLEDALDSAEASASEGKDGQALTALRGQRRDVADRMRRADVLVGEIKALNASLKTITSRMRERQDAIAGTVERIDALEHVVTACRPQGIPSMLLDGVLAPIESEATRLLNAVPGGEGMALRFEQARALKSRTGAREVLDIVVTTPAGRERLIESLSSGETVRASMALVFAMITVLGARRGGEALDTVFLDEPLGPLDQDAVPAFVEVLRSAVSSSSLSSVMVVSHDERVIEALPQRVEFEREEGGVTNVTVVA